MSTRLLKVAVIGRSQMLLDAARLIAGRGHRIGFVATAKPSGYEGGSIELFRALADDANAQFASGAGWTRDPQQRAWLADQRFDVAVSMNWIARLQPEIRSLFAHGVFNAHPGDLPRYRGNACPTWAILNNEPHVGLCVHLMADEIDAGPMAFRERFPLASDTDYTDVFQWLLARVPALLAAVVESVSEGGVPLEPQPADPALALRCFPRRPGDGLIDWSKPADEIRRVIRATARPLDGAWTTLDGAERVVIWRAASFSVPYRISAIPGQIAFAADGDPVICCGSGVIRLTDIAVEGCAGVTEAKVRLLRSLRARLR